MSNTRILLITIVAALGMLGLAFDYRVMREDRGFMFVPAVDIGAIYSTGFTELMRAKVSRNVLRDMITFAKRYSASDLVEEGVVSVSPTRSVSAEVQQALRSNTARWDHRQRCRWRSWWRVRRRR